MSHAQANISDSEGQIASLAIAGGEMRIRAINDRVIIKPIEADAVSAGGLHLVESARQKKFAGRVLAAGPGRLDENGRLIPNTIHAGDLVVFGMFAGTQLWMDDQHQYGVLKESEIDAVVESADASAMSFDNRARLVTGADLDASRRKAT